VNLLRNAIRTPQEHKTFILVAMPGLLQRPNRLTVEPRKSNEPFSCARDNESERHLAASPS
jgi:hypothetical protein